MGKGRVIAGFILTIVGLVLGLLGGLVAIASLTGLPVAIIGLVLSVSGGKAMKASGNPAGLATAGLVIGIIATVITAIAFFTCGLCVICAAGVSVAV